MSQSKLIQIRGKAAPNRCKQLCQCHTLRSRYTKECSELKVQDKYKLSQLMKLLSRTLYDGSELVLSKVTEQTPRSGLNLLAGCCLTFHLSVCSVHIFVYLTRRTSLPIFPHTSALVGLEGSVRLYSHTYLFCFNYCGMCCRLQPRGKFGRHNE